MRAPRAVGSGAGPVEAVDYDAVADLAALGLAEVGFDEGVGCQPAIVARSPR